MTSRDPLSRGLAFLVEWVVFACIVSALYVWSRCAARRGPGNDRPLSPDTKAW